MSERVPFASVAWLGLVLLSCGGEAPRRGDPETPEALPDEASDEMAEQESAPAAPPDPCAAGSCVPCGEAVCLEGFYCEESVSACGWVPECAEAPSCACLARALPDCSCEERASGVYVSCR